MAVTNFDDVEARSLNVATKIAVTEIANDQAVDTLVFPILSGDLSVADDVVTIVVPVAGTIVSYRLYAQTAPTGQSAIFDIHKNGVTLFTTQANRPTIAAGANAASTTLPDVLAVAAGDRLSLCVDQLGSGTEGTNVLTSLALKRQHVV